MWYLLTPHQRRAATALLGLMLIGMVLETLGIGLIIPAIGVMAQVDMVVRYPAAEPILRSLGYPSRERLAIACMVILVVVAAVRALFLALLTWRQARFVSGTHLDLAQRFFVGYLRQPYAFHLRRNSAQLILTINSETSVFANVGLMPGLLLLTETFVLIGISTLLFVVEPIGSILVTTALAVGIGAFSILTRDRVLLWGQERQLHDRFRSQYLQEGLGGAKEVKVLGREGEFLARYLVHGTESARSGERQAVMQQMPRLFLELFAVVGLAGLVLIMIWRGRPLDAVLPTLGLFAAAAFRLMPSVNRLLSAVQNVRYSRPVIDTLYEEMRLIEDTLEPQPGEMMPFKRALVLDQVSFRYPSSEALALRSISLSIPQGSSAGFVGMSGAGKSTLVDIILGLLTPTHGNVRVDGADIQTNLRGWQDQMGYVPQAIFLSDDTLRRNVAFGLPDTEIEEAAVERAVCAAQLDPFVSELPDGLDTVVGERGVRLSGGQRQRVGIARALYHNPSVLVLDEATSSLDTETERGVMDSVRALKGDRTLIIVAHRLTTVEHCDFLFRLERGELTEGGETAVILGRASDPLMQARAGPPHAD